MAHAQFIHLRTHTAYSLSEGAIPVKDLVKQCVGHNMPAVAVTDTNNMFAALEFSTAAAGAGVQPIAGVSLEFKPIEFEVSGQLKPQKKRVKWTLILLAQSELGYQNLMKIVSKAHLTSDPAEGVNLPLDALEGFSEDVICLTGGVSGPVGQCLLAGKADEARSILARLVGYFPERLYVEIGRHGLPEEDALEEDMLDLAYEMNLPIVATNEPYFVSPDMYEAHDTLLCIADGTYVAATDRRKLNKDFRFKSPQEMVELFKDIPEAIENTVNIARRCHWRVKTIAPLLPNFTRGMDASEADMLYKMASEGLVERLEVKAKQDALSFDVATIEQADWAEEYWQRLKYEIRIINQMGFPGYFLIVADFIQWAKDNDIPVGPGRGSGAGSLVAWALKITDLDPLRFSLLFERFLNPERVSMPDFDIDFCQDRREEVIQYVQNKYGHDHVAQIITFGKLQARAVVKACGRALQQPYMVTDRLSKLIPNDPGSALTLKEAIEAEPRLQHEINDDVLTATVMDRALKLEGLYAHSSTHAAGVVIGDRPLDQLVPLYRDPKSDMPVTQFNMKWVEQAGLVKFDFLGLKTLTVLDRAVRYVAERGILIDLPTLPLDDKPSYALLASGDAAGVFQLESSGMRSTLKGLKPDCFEDIIAIVALYRPGPMDNIPTYINRKHGREPIEYPHAILEEILAETNGIIVYQEQVMQIAQVMSGYSLGEADLLRRAMGKKIKEEMDKQRSRFVDGAVERDIDRNKADEIFDLVTKFASYGFNKSHAAAYALVAYHTAYMKANYPVEFMAAIMTLDMHNTDKLGAFKHELKRMQVPVLLPDINKSDVHFTVERMPDLYCDESDPRANRAVRYALAAIKGVGEKAVESIVREREDRGPFKDIFDFAERVDPKLLNKRQLEQLASAGAFDSLLDNRAQAYGVAEMVLRYANSLAAERQSNQTSLFGEGSGAVADKPPLPHVPAWTSIQMLEYELKAIGYYLSAHPLDTYEAILKREGIIPSSEVLKGTAPGSQVRMAGVVSNWREAKSRNTGRKFGSLAMSDKEGEFELLVFEDDIENTRALIQAGGPLVVTVQIKAGRDEDEPVRLSARGIESLETIASLSNKALIIDLNETASADSFSAIKSILDRKAGGKGRVTLRLPVDGGKHVAEFTLNGRYKITPELIQAVQTDMSVDFAEEA